MPCTFVQVVVLVGGNFSSGTDSQPCACAKFSDIFTALHIKTISTLNP
jgi:hypothetical protein